MMLNDMKIMKQVTINNAIDMKSLSKKEDISKKNIPKKNGIKIEISSTTATILNSKTSEVRQDKIDSIKEKIANGEYMIDTNKLAEAIMESAPYIFE